MLHSGGIYIYKRAIYIKKLFFLFSLRVVVVVVLLLISSSSSSINQRAARAKGWAIATAVKEVYPSNPRQTPVSVGFSKP